LYVRLEAAGGRLIASLLLRRVSVNRAMAGKKEDKKVVEDRQKVVVRNGSLLKKRFAFASRDGLGAWARCKEHHVTDFLCAATPNQRKAPPSIWKR
jgi:hypothetical protein